MIGASTVFWAPGWPSRLLARWQPHLRRGRDGGGGPGGHGGAPVRIAVAAVPAPGRRPVRVRWWAAAAGVWVAVQLALPLRHLLYPGDERWTGQGYRFAWNVLLTEKAGSVSFVVTDPASGRRWVADPTELYTPTQVRAMSTEPDLIVQAAHAIAAEERRRGREVEVRADAWVSLDGRPAQRLIDPTVDLAHVHRDPWSDPWIQARQKVRPGGTRGDQSDMSD
jgi:hypothetical protein